MNIANGNKEYKTTHHWVYSCQYHVIFCPKMRRSVLVDGVDERMNELCHEIADECGFAILEMEVMPDHVHMLIDCDPRCGIYECVKQIKGKTAHALREEFPALKSKLPCLWTRSAFVSTCGDVSLSMVKKYIEEQKNV